MIPRFANALSSTVLWISPFLYLFVHLFIYIANRAVSIDGEAIFIFVRALLVVAESTAM